MFSLAIETATPICSVAISKNGTVVWTQTEQQSGKHAELLPILVSQALKDMEISLSDIKSVVFHAGPGSYTGLRIGLSFLKGLFFQQTVEAIALGTLAGMAFYGSHIHPNANRLHAILDARRAHVYYQRFKRSNGVLTSEIEPQVEEIQNVQSLLKSGDVLVGTGVSRFISQENDGILSLDALAGFSATHLLECVAHQKEENNWMRFVELSTFEPDYLGSPV